MAKVRNIALGEESVRYDTLTKKKIAMALKMAMLETNLRMIL